MSALNSQAAVNVNDISTSFNKNVEPSSDLWRQFLPSRFRRPNPDGFFSENSPVNLYNVSVVAQHNFEDLLALGNTTESKKEITVLRLSSFSSKSSSSDSEKLPSFKVLFRFTYSDLVDISWVDKQMLCSNSRGSVVLYEIKSHDNKYGDKQVSLMTEYVHKKLTDSSSQAAIPGTLMETSRIHRVLLNRIEKNRFISLENYNFHIWDLEHVDNPIFSQKASNHSACFSITWNPHVSDRFMLGNTNGTLKMFDLRVPSSEIWKRRRAHNRCTVRDIKWNPFIPHWIATSSEDATIQLWDLRFVNQPLLILEDHLHSANKIEWSSTLCDILISGGSDRHCKLWSLSLKPHFVLASQEDLFHSSIVGTGFSRSDPYVCFGISRNGQIISSRMHSNFLKPLIPSRFSDLEKEEREVEQKIFFRNFSEGFSSALALAEKLQSQKNFSKALEILELCYERTPPDPEAGIPFSNRTIIIPISETSSDAHLALKIFSEELRQYTYYIPPNFPETTRSNASNPSILEKISKLKLTLELQVFVEKANAEELIERKGDICDMLERDKSSISMTLLHRVVSVIISQFYLEAIELAERLAILFAKERWNDFLSIPRLILYPMIYEFGKNDNNTDNSSGGGGSGGSNTWENISKYTGNKLVNAIVDSLLNPADIIIQISFLKEFTRMLWSHNQEDEKQLVSYMEEKKPKLILSATINRIYLNALRYYKHFDKFYIHIEDLLKVLRSSIFYLLISFVAIGMCRWLHLNIVSMIRY